MNNKEQEVIEIDLLDLGYRLWSKIHYIILCTMIGALLLNAYAFLMIEQTYESTSKIYVVSSSTDSVVNLSDLNIGTSLTKDYEELILSYTVLSRVIDEMNLDTDYTTLRKQISIVNPSDTRILNVTATANSPEKAMELSNTVSEIAIEYLPETMNTLAPNIAQAAQLPEQRANPSYTKYTLMGALLGALFCIIFLTIGYILDDTIHTPEEMEKYFDMVPLTTIAKNSSLMDENDK